MKGFRFFVVLAGVACLVIGLGCTAWAADKPAVKAGKAAVDVKPAGVGALKVPCPPGWHKKESFIDPSGRGTAISIAPPTSRH